MAKLPTYEEMGKKVAEEALNEIYGGKTIREWIEILVKQQPWEDCISRQAVLDTTICEGISCNECSFNICEDGQPGCLLKERIEKLPPVTPQPKTGHCKNCKYFEYDSVAKVDGIPLIVAHEICKKWGDGCKTRENGYCFLFEPQESEGKA